jgi:hypothetical protein
MRAHTEARRLPSWKCPAAMIVAKTDGSTIWYPFLNASSKTFPGHQSRKERGTAKKMVVVKIPTKEAE